MLNSKNVYLENCLSRIQVSEDRFQRKMRELRENEEKKEHQAGVAKLRDEMRRAKDWTKIMTSHQKAYPSCS